MITSSYTISPIIVHLLTFTDVTMKIPTQVFPLFCCRLQLLPTDPLILPLDHTLEADHLLVGVIDHEAVVTAGLEAAISHWVVISTWVFQASPIHLPVDGCFWLHPVYCTGDGVGAVFLNPGVVMTSEGGF